MNEYIFISIVWRDESMTFSPAEALNDTSINWIGQCSCRAKCKLKKKWNDKHYYLNGCNVVFYKFLTHLNRFCRSRKSILKRTLKYPQNSVDNKFIAANAFKCIFMCEK